MSNRGNEHYTKKAKKEWYLARSAYKLMELDEKYHLLEDVYTGIDIWCAPGSWLQYMSSTLAKTVSDIPTQIIWFDLKEVEIQLPGVSTYVQDISDMVWVQQVLDSHHIQQVDLIVSDMAPDTIGMADIDAIRCIWLIEKTLWIYDTFLKEWGKFAIKVFMWPGFDELVRDLKTQYWAANIATFKPKSCRPKSKETYIVKRG